MTLRRPLGAEAAEGEGKVWPSDMEVFVGSDVTGYILKHPRSGGAAPPSELSILPTTSHHHRRLSLFTNFHGETDSHYDAVGGTTLVTHDVVDNALRQFAATRAMVAWDCAYNGGDQALATPREQLRSAARQVRRESKSPSQPFSSWSYEEQVAAVTPVVEALQEITGSTTTLRQEGLTDYRKRERDVVPPASPVRESTDSATALVSPTPTEFDEADIPPSPKRQALGADLGDALQCPNLQAGVNVLLTGTAVTTYASRTVATDPRAGPIMQGAKERITQELHQPKVDFMKELRYGLGMSKRETDMIAGSSLPMGDSAGESTTSTARRSCPAPRLAGPSCCPSRVTVGPPPLAGGYPTKGGGVRFLPKSYDKPPVIKNRSLSCVFGEDGEDDHMDSGTESEGEAEGGVDEYKDIKEAVKRYGPFDHAKGDKKERGNR